MRFFVWLLPLPLLATNYYIASTGLDSNPGTQAQPWQTVAKVNASRFAAGDTINFHGGDTFTGTTLSVSLVGSAGNLISLTSYGTGRATISVGNGTTPGIYHAISLTNPQYLTISNLILVGTGWAGSGSAATVYNGGRGIYILSSLTSGPKLQSIAIVNCDISGFFDGIWLDAGKTSGISSTVGFNNLAVTGNTVHDNLSQQILVQGYAVDAGGPVDQITNVAITDNMVQRAPGDPNSGSGGVHGLIKTEAGGINVGSVTGLTIARNLVTDIAGFGGVLSGLTFGGSSAIGASNSASVVIDYNEVARTGCSTHFDGSAIDLDQDTVSSEVAYNLTYDNVGPAVQVGSFGGFTTSNSRIHHNISYNDVRGNNAGGVSEQGVFRLWGFTNNTQIFNNTVDFGAVTGTAAAVNFEVGSNTNVLVVDNVFRMPSGVSAYWANRIWNATHLGASVQTLGNVYDASGGALLISNDNGTGAQNITTLAAWQGLGYETLNAVLYGVSAGAQLRNVATFAPPSNGFIGTGQPLAGVTNFDLAPNSPALQVGIDPSLVSVTLGTVDYHGNPSTRNGKIDIGASSFQAIPATGQRGAAVLRGSGVAR